MTKHSVKELENTHTELKNRVTAKAQAWALNQMPLMCHLYQFQRSFHLTRIDWVCASAIASPSGVHLPLRSPSPSMSTDAGNYFWLKSPVRWYFLVVGYSSPFLHNVICWVMQGREMDWYACLWREWLEMPPLHLSLRLRYNNINKLSIMSVLNQNVNGGFRVFFVNIAVLNGFRQ